MTTRRIALILTSAATAAWSAKAVAIGIAGGLDRSPLEGPLFLLGLACCIAAAATTGLVLLDASSTTGRVVAGVAGVVGTILFVGLCGTIAARLQPANPGWAWGEVNLWAGMLGLLAANLLLVPRRHQSDSPPPDPGEILNGRRGRGPEA